MAKKPQQDPLDKLATGPLEDVIAMLLWQNRHTNPSMTAVIKVGDIQGLADCCEYLKVKPSVVVVRPGGREAQPAIPARGTRRGTPATPAEPPRPHVVVALVNAGTMDAIRPLENNDEDAELLLRGSESARWKAKAGVLSTQANGMAGSGDVSTAVLTEIAQCLQVFAES